MFLGGIEKSGWAWRLDKSESQWWSRRERLGKSEQHVANEHWLWLEAIHVRSLVSRETNPLGNHFFFGKSIV